MWMLEKCYDNKMAKLPGDPFYRDHHMRLANKKKKTCLAPIFLLNDKKAFCFK